MASPKMTADRRKSLPKSEFGIPGQRKYPMDTPGRAANAKARASQAVNAGRMSKSTAAKIDAKANGILSAGQRQRIEKRRSQGITVGRKRGLLG